jgi:hypothetical protein
MTKSKVTPRPRVCKLRFFYSTHTRHESLRNGLEGVTTCPISTSPQKSRVVLRASRRIFGSDARSCARRFIQLRSFL